MPASESGDEPMGSNDAPVELSPPPLAVAQVEGPLILYKDWGAAYDALVRL